MKRLKMTIAYIKRHLNKPQNFEDDAKNSDNFNAK